MKIGLTIIIIFLCSLSSAVDESVNVFKDVGKAFTVIARNTSASVVFIETERKQQANNQWQFFSPFEKIDEFPFGNDFFNYFFKRGIPRNFQERDKGETFKVLGQGSGFIISADGLILTNNHVVGDADKVIVKLLDGRIFEAKVIGTDQHTDIAIIKIKANNLTVLPLGNSNDLEVGEWVIALGNPFGLSHTLTAGVVSAKGRSSVGITDYENFIQTDAAINLGNSGGPLINLDGSAVGMNTAIFSRTGGSMGIGFAIPINIVKGIKDQLIKNGKVIRGYLGILIQNLTNELALQFGLKEMRGIIISDVTKDSPAEKAGLKAGDIILEFDDFEVKDVGSFRNLVALTPPGERKNLKVIRDGKQKKIKATIGKLSSNILTSSRPKIIENDFGFTVENLNSTYRQKYGLSSKDQGVIVGDVDPSSVAAMAGIKPGMLIKEVNQIKVNSIGEFKRASKKNKLKKSILLLIQDGDYSRYVSLSIN